MSSYINKEKVEKTVSALLEKMITEADPEELGEYRSFFKKRVPLFRRTWAAAYLLMLYDKDNGFVSSRRTRNSKHITDAGGNTPNGDRFRAHGEDARKFQLSEEESKRLFFSIGRNRKVFPWEILGLIITKAAVTKEDVGAIRILDNYSFIQVRDTVAEKIIEVLNGISFKGRTLTVNYARSRKDEEEDVAAENGNEYGKEESAGDENRLFDSEKAS